MEKLMNITWEMRGSRGQLANDPNGLRQLGLHKALNEQIDEELALGEFGLARGGLGMFRSKTPGRLHKLDVGRGGQWLQTISLSRAAPCEQGPQPPAEEAMAGQFEAPVAAGPGN